MCPALHYKFSLSALQVYQQHNIASPHTSSFKNFAIPTNSRAFNSMIYHDIIGTYLWYFFDFLWNEFGLESPAGSYHHY